MNLVEILVDPQSLLAIFVGIAVFATIVMLAMPLLEKDEFNARMKSAALERDSIRARERARLASQSSSKSATGLRQEGATGVVQLVVDRLNLKKTLADEKTFINLVQAGYRKQTHIYVFLFFRVVAPVILFFVTLGYVYMVMDATKPLFIKVLISLGVAMLGFYLPNLYVKNQAGKRALSIKRAWPDALDLMLICVESGISIEQAFQRVAKEIGLQSPELAEELVLTNTELSYLQERRKAYENLATRTGLDGVKAVTTALIQAERYGTPLGVAIRVLAQENRDMRMAEAEKKAASLPPKLTVPMIVFFLPVLFMVILGPAFIQLSRSF